MPDLAAAFLAAIAAPGSAATPPAPDIRGIVPPQPYFIGASAWWLVLAAAVLVLAGLAAWYFFFRRRGPKPGPKFTPREIAERRLQALAGRAVGLDPRTFGNEAADVLREFIGAQFGLHPKRQTSPEFLASVQGSRVFTKTEHVLLADFLEGCDLLKFARADATPARKEHLLTQATDFVRSSAVEEGKSSTTGANSGAPVHL